MLELRHMFFCGRFLREIPWQHELGFEYGARFLYATIKRCAHPLVDGVLNAPLHVLDGIAGAALVPGTLQVFGDTAQLSDELIAEVLGRDLAPFLLPEPNKPSRVVPHDDTGVRAADKTVAFLIKK